MWTIEADGCYEVFAGGTRLEAARQAGMKTVPVFVHDGLSDEQISRKADEDNENDEYHERVGLLDVWAECYRLWKEEALDAGADCYCKRMAENNCFEEDSLASIAFKVSSSSSVRRDPGRRALGGDFDGDVRRRTFEVADHRASPN